nr:uncharacterized protein LOC129280646 [Lytechinus pictus]
MSDVSTQGQVQIPFNDTTGSYYLDSLEPETRYSVYITLWNKDREGPPSVASSGMTDHDQTAICNSASGSLVPWVLFGITFFIAVVSIIAFVFLWRRYSKTNSDPEPPKASRTKSVKEESTYENPVFDEPPVKQYESLDAITTNDDYMIPDAP